MTGILLVDDHTSFREALAFMLDSEPDMRVVAQAGSADEALRSQGSAWRLAVVDLGLPDRPGHELIEQLLEYAPDAKVMVLTASTSPADLAAAYEAGASGVVAKTAALSQIIDAIRTVAGGGSLINAAELVEMLRRARSDRARVAARLELCTKLTAREHEVLRALASGQSNKQIAAQLHITVETQRTHIVNILAKLGAHSQLEALVIAARHGIVGFA